MKTAFLFTIAFCLFISSIEQLRPNQSVNTCGKSENIMPTSKEDCKEDGVNCCYVKIEGKDRTFCSFIPSKYDKDVKKDFAEAIGADESAITIECNRAKILKMCGTMITILFSLLF